MHAHMHTQTYTDTHMQRHPQQAHGSSRELTGAASGVSKAWGNRMEPQRGPHLFHPPHWVQALLGVNGFCGVLEFCTHSLPLTGPETTGNYYPHHTLSSLRLSP